MLGRFEEALPVYREPDAPLRGDALLALGRLEPILATPQAPHPWQMLWGAYRAHALSLAGRADEAVALARALVPIDVYEWTHIFECLLRCGRLDAVDMRSFLYRPAHAGGHRWADLARRRMRADYLRLGGDPPANLGETYRELVEEYDRGGLPWERALTRLSRGRRLESRQQGGGAGCECGGAATGSALRHEDHRSGCAGVGGRARGRTAADDRVRGAGAAVGQALPDETASVIRVTASGTA